MKCEKILQWMSSYIDNELEGEALASFKDHLSDCTSCRIELEILEEIIKDINELDKIDLPHGFHQDLMEKIKLANQIQQDKVIQISKKDKKWSSNWRVLSGLAAAFVFSVLIFQVFNLNAPKDSVPESISLQPRTGNIQRDMPQEVMPSEENDMANESSSIRMIGPENPRLETWEIHTKEYETCTENIIQTSQEMELETIIMDDVITGEDGRRQRVLEITLNQEIKAILKSKVTEICIDDQVDFYENDLQQEGGESLGEILVITINEIK